MADYTYTAEDHAAVASATRIVYVKYRKYVEFADVQQELYLWLLDNYEKVVRWRASHSEKHAERTLVKALRNAAERYCRTEKAERIGYDTEDEFFYSIPMIADLLSLAFDPEWMEPKGIDYTEDHQNGAPSADLVTMVADVSRAYDGLPEPDQRLLRRVYGAGEVSQNLAVLSLEWGCSQSAAYNRVRRVVGRVRAALGGPNPWREVE